jgi:predicted nucleotide-binding protein
MLKALENLEANSAQQALSSLTQALLPVPDKRTDSERIEGLPAIERDILREVCERLRLKTDIPSPSEIPAVLELLSEELSDIVLKQADVGQLQKKTFERESREPSEPVLEQKPVVLINSSSEGLEYAEGVRQQLQHSASVEMWTENEFFLGRTAIENMIRNAGRFDFAAFVLTRDDVGWLRGERDSTARTSIAFEAGFFVGRLGPNRTFLIMPKIQRSLTFIGDLAGVATITYDPELRPIEQALGPVIHYLVTRIQRFGSVSSKRLRDDSI